MKMLGYRYLAREHRLPEPPEHEHDHHHAASRLPDPTVCPSCDATYHGGHWTWDHAPRGAHRETCPACRRMQEHDPAGYVLIKSSPFVNRHHREILDYVRAREAQEMAEHPLQRIIGIERVPQGLQVSTTHTHLARAIGDVLHDAWSGDLQVFYNEDEQVLRAVWRRG